MNIYQLKDSNFKLGKTKQIIAQIGNKTAHLAIYQPRNLFIIEYMFTAHFFGYLSTLTLLQLKTETIYVRVYEDRTDLIRAAIIGAPATPYHDGLFFFDIYLPADYPHEPPVSKSL